MRPPLHQHSYVTCWKHETNQPTLIHYQQNSVNPGMWHPVVLPELNHSCVDRTQKYFQFKN